MHFNAPGPSLKRLGDRRRRDQVEDGVAVGQPAAVQETEPRCVEGGSCKPEPLVRMAERAGIRRAAALLAVPLELCDRGRRVLLREFLRGGLFGRLGEPLALSRNQQPDRPSGKDGKQIAVSLQEASEVRLERRRHQIEEHDPTCGRHADRQALWKQADACRFRSKSHVRQAFARQATAP